LVDFTNTHEVALRDMDDLNGRIAIVTGAGTGIGRAIALRLAEAGADVGLFDLDEASAHATRDQIRAIGRRATVTVGNVAERGDVLGAAAAMEHELGPINILVNNVGILRTCPFLEQSIEDWHRVFATNLDGVFHFSQAVLPGMVARCGGCIINMSSWTGKKGVANHAAYGATKAAILNLTQSLAEEFGQSRIRVNAVCPGIIVDTKMREVAEDLNRAQGLPDVATRTKALPLRRPGYPSEIADVVAFLASDRAAYITGEAVNITGGLWMN